MATGGDQSASEAAGKGLGREFVAGCYVPQGQEMKTQSCSLGDQEQMEVKEIKGKVSAPPTPHWQLYEFMRRKGCETSVCLC